MFSKAWHGWRGGKGLMDINECTSDKGGYDPYQLLVFQAFSCSAERASETRFCLLTPLRNKSFQTPFANFRVFKLRNYYVKNISRHKR